MNNNRLLHDGKQRAPFYGRREWRDVREWALKRDNYICRDCLDAYKKGRTGRVNGATLVHHIVPVEEAPERALDMTNLVSLCDACHARRHPEKNEKKAAKNKRDGAATDGIRIIKIK